ncbi:unnamed protein product [Bursaphelenchus xylophilus]|uniref:Cell division cycle protein 27 homolog n=1 Tax=Bursaphelenchus xylophilus TaxID=6326 RepID=A0A1I7S4N6_BURXY|nr:unnamed protein product [Bursaphelenchus xylophilus]CAG9117259.1 unnamed protein product [Bursaphelenchus xylophilus]
MDTFEAIKELYEEELYEDVLYYAQVRLQMNNIDSVLDPINLVMLFKYLGDSNFHLDQFAPSLKFYDNALLFVQPGLKLPKAFTSIEIKYMKYRALCRLKRFDTAFDMLSAIPKTEHVPKTRLAMAKLHSTRLSYSRNGLSPRPCKDMTEMVNFYDGVVAQCPNAYHCVNKLYFFGTGPSMDLTYDNDDTAQLLFKAKELRSLLLPVEAIEVLKKADQRNVQVVLEMAELYNIVGNYPKAKYELERLLTLNPHGVLGLDFLARIYNKLEKDKEKERLEKLLHHCLNCDERAPETYVILGFMARGRRDDTAQTFVSKALSTYMCGPDRVNALILKANLHLDSQRKNWADECLRHVLTYDHRNVDAMEMLVKLVVLRKTATEVRLIAETVKKNLGTSNPRAQYIYAHTFTHFKPTKPEYENMLDEIVNKAPYMFTAVMDYANLLEERGDIKKAINILRRGCEACPTLELKETLSILEEKIANDSQVITEFKLLSPKNEPFDEPTSSSNILNPSRNPNATERNTTPVSTQAPSAQRTRPPAAPRRQRQANFRSVALEFIQEPLEFQDEPEAMPNVGELIYADDVEEEPMDEAELDAIMDDDNGDPGEPIMEDVGDSHSEHSLSDN